MQPKRWAGLATRPGPGHNLHGVVSASVVLKILSFSLMLDYNFLKRQDQF